MVAVVAVAVVVVLYSSIRNIKEDKGVTLIRV